MAIFKCKICGGTLEIDGAQSVATCEYCGTKQTIPKLDDDRKANLYDRANHFRLNNDFDKAMGIYEIILNEDNTDAEAYWSIVLCRYGIEYVEDPTTHKRIPTVNRAQFTSIFDDEDYKSALSNADGYQREIYECEANAINEIQKGFLAISQKEEPFDVFICYKETDNNGRRTQDSVLATELYNELTREGFKVFFSRITLEDKLGIAYEPYIFAALNSAKVMVVLGTRPEHFNAVWVKNEWSRYLALIKNGAKKTLIPAYRDIDPYDLPEEFSHLQAQDMSRLGFMQDLIRGIKKIVELNEPKNTVIKETIVTGTNAGIEPLFKRASMALADGEFGRADAFYEQILNQEPENAEAYVGKLLAELHVKKKSDLANSEVSFENSNHYKKAIQFANAELKDELSKALKTVLARIDNKKKQEIYQRAKILLNGARDIPSCKNAQKLFLSISGYLDAEQCIASCQEKIDTFQKEWEQLRLEQRRKEEERKIAIKKAKKRSLIISLCLLLVAVISVIAYVSISYVVIPNTQYQDALEMIEEQKYDEAIALLKTAKGNALFDKTISKIDQAIDDAETAKERKKAAEEAKKIAEEAKKALEQTIANGMADISNANYEQAIRKLLKAGVITHIVYQCEGGNLVNSDSKEVTYAYESEFSGLLTSERTGYRFVGWSCETYEYKEAETRFYLVFKANWSEKEYVIKYNLDGGTASNITEYGVEDDAFTLIAPKKTGYTFIGWTGSDLTQPTMKVTIPTGSHGDRTYTANWKAKQYTVFLDAAGGTVSNQTIPVTYNNKFSLPFPYRGMAYEFLGWYNGTQKVESGTWNLDGNITLVAKWGLLDFALTYDMGDVPATTNNPTSFTIESPEIILTDPSYEHCTFEGWYKDPNFTERVTSIPTGTSNGMILYAKWTIHTFTIEYDLNGGECSGSFTTEYTVFDLPIRLPYPEKWGHSFSCWTDTDLDGDRISSIEECGDYHLYANYINDGMELEGLVGPYGTHYYVSYSGNATEIEIPKYDTNGKIITAIYRINAPNLETVKMSNCIELIESNAFYNCKKLKNITLSTNIKHINSDAFGGCDALQVQIYEGGRYLGTKDNPYYALIAVNEGMASQRTIHEQTVLLGANSFKNNPWLTSIIIPSNVKYLGGAFNYCMRLVEVYNLSSLNIQSGDSSMGSFVKVVHTTISQESYVKQQGDYWFYCDSENGVYELLGYTGNDTTLILPNHINGNCYDIYEYAFYECTNLKSVTIPQGVTKIGNYSFYNCSGLLNMVIPESVVEIGDYSFYNCSRLSNLVIPEGVVEIGYNSFFNCRELLSVTLPSTLTKIGSDAFHNCINLMEIYNLTSLNIVLGEYGFGWLGYYAKAIHTSLDEPSCWIYQDNYVFFVNPENDVYLLYKYLGNESTLVLPNNINGHSYDIYENAFSGNTQLTNIIISDGVTSIGASAFAGCSNLNYVYIGKDVSSIHCTAFNNCPNLVAADFAVTTGWTREGSGKFESDVVYESTDLADSENAAYILKNPTTGKPMIRGE